MGSLIATPAKTGMPLDIWFLLSFVLISIVICIVLPLLDRRREREAKTIEAKKANLQERIRNRHNL
jgi:hypothetical protein